jgi:hypothetical protein
MLYSEEFYAAARQRLRPGGIPAQWLPGATPRISLLSPALSITRSPAFGYSAMKRIGASTFWQAINSFPIALRKTYRARCRPARWLIS